MSSAGTHTRHCRRHVQIVSLQLSLPAVSYARLFCAMSPLFANVFADHAVLDASASRIWGSTAAHDIVHLSLDGSFVANSTADASGRWSALLPPMPTGPTAFTLRASAVPSLRQQLLDDVVFGRVFICAGQSNMDEPLASHTENAAPEDWAPRPYPELQHSAPHVAQHFHALCSLPRVTVLHRVLCGGTLPVQVRSSCG